MTARTYKRPDNRHRAPQPARRQATAHSPVAPVRRVTQNPATTRPSLETARTRDGARRVQSRMPQRRAGGWDGLNDWLKAAVLLCGFVVAVIVAAHVLVPSNGSAPTASSPPHSSNVSSSTAQPTTSLSSSVYLPPVVTTAKALGIAPATLQADIQAGETVPQLAQAQHVALSTVNAAYLQGVQQANEQAVQGGGVTQAQADQEYQQEVQQVQQGQYDILTGNYFSQQVPGP